MYLFFQNLPSCNDIQKETTKPLTHCNLIDLVVNHQLDEEPKFSLIEIDINGVAVSLIHIYCFSLV